MNAARLTVRAVMVSDGRAPALGASLDALLAQDPAPDFVHLLLTDAVDPPAGEWPERVDVRQVDASSFGRAVGALLDDVAAGPHELLWLLHDDVAPLPGALAMLTATARKRRRAGVIGAAQVQWDDPTRLVSLGTTTSRVGARRIAMVEDQDVNQGQYDDRDDVLAVALGGALVRRDVWEQLDGVDPAYEGWSDSLDFCRRTWRAGYDVVAVPRAKVRHSQERLYGRRGGSRGGRRSTYSARRASEWYHAVAFAPLWAVPLLMVWTWASALARAVWRIAQNEPRMIVADLMVPWRLVARLPWLYGSRRRRRRAGRAGKAAEQRLLAGPRAIARHVRAVEWGTRNERAAAVAPSQVVKAELAVARGRRRLALGALSLALAALSIVMRPDWLLGLIGGDMLVGTTLGVTDTSVGDLWARALTGWSTQSLGAPALDAGLSGLLLPLALVPGGLAVGLGLLLLFAPLAAGIAAWAAAGAFTRSLGARFLAAVIYALWPAALLSVEQGRVAAVIVHIAVPWVVMGLARAGGWQRGERVGGGDEFPRHPLASASAGMGAAAMLGVVVIAAPALIAPAVIVVVVLGAVAGRRRWRVWGTLVPMLVISAPGMIAAAQVGGTDGLAIAMREPGPGGTAGAQSALDLLTGLDLEATGVPDAVTVVARALVAAVVVGAAAVALVGRRRVLAALALLAGAGGLGIAVFAQTITLAPDTGAGGASTAGWYGPGMSVVAISLLVVWCATTADVWAAGKGAVRAWRRVGALSVAVILTVATAGAATAQVWPGHEPHGDVTAASREVLPLVASIEQETSAHQRVLTLTTVDGSIEYAVLASDGVDVLSTAGTLLMDGTAAARPRGEPVASAAQLGSAVAGIMTGRESAVTELAEWGIGVVVAAPGSREIVESLALTQNLQLMGASERGTTWRVGAAEPEDRVASAWFEPTGSAADGSRLPAHMDRMRGTVDAPSAGQLVIAQTADPAWTAAIGRDVLDPVVDERGRQVFAIDEAGTVTFEYDNRNYRLWFWAAVVALFWAAIGAIPARSRRARMEDDA